MRQPRQLIVPGRFESLSEIAAFITQAAREAGLNDDEVFHVEMAVDEACSNVIEHAYATQTGDIDLACRCPAAGQRHGRVEALEAARTNTAWRDQIKKFEAGYTQGAKHLKPDVQVKAVYAGVSDTAFRDPQKADEEGVRLMLPAGGMPTA